MDNTYVYEGADLKLDISIESVNSLTMDDYDFEVELYCDKYKRLKLSKSQLKRIDSNNYLAKIVNTENLGKGVLKCRIIAKIPDGDFNTGERVEVVEIITKINII